MCAYCTQLKKHVVYVYGDAISVRNEAGSPLHAALSLGRCSVCVCVHACMCDFIVVCVSCSTWQWALMARCVHAPWSVAAQVHFIFCPFSDHLEYGYRRTLLTAGAAGKSSLDLKLENKWGRGGRGDRDNDFIFISFLVTKKFFLNCHYLYCCFVCLWPTNIFFKFFLFILILNFIFFSFFMCFEFVFIYPYN